MLKTLFFCLFLSSCFQARSGLELDVQLLKQEVLELKKFKATAIKKILRLEAKK